MALETHVTLCRLMALQVFRLLNAFLDLLQIFSEPLHTFIVKFFDVFLHRRVGFTSFIADLIKLLLIIALLILPILLVSHFVFGFLLFLEDMLRLVFNSYRKSVFTDSLHTSDPLFLFCDDTHCLVNLVTTLVGKECLYRSRGWITCKTLAFFRNNTSWASSESSLMLHRWGSRLNCLHTLGFMDKSLSPPCRSWSLRSDDFR